MWGHFLWVKPLSTQRVKAENSTASPSPPGVPIPGFAAPLLPPHPD